jgi:DNA replication protein DnaC
MTKAKQYNMKNNISPKQLKNNIERYNNFKLPKICEKLKAFDPRAWKALENNQGSMEDFEEVPGSCYIYGEVGNGKTVNLMWRVLEWTRLRYENSIHRINFEIINIDDFFLEIKSSYDKNNSTTEETILKKYQNADLVAFDEFGLFPTSEWAFRILYMIINYRYSNFKPTMYAANISLGKVAELLNDDRISSRIEHDCKNQIFNFNGKSRRK